MATILLTGVTGTVGSSLAPFLKHRGHRLICLVRPKSGRNPKERLSDVFGEMGNGDALIGDIVLPGLGVSDSDKRQWKGKIDKVIHCASSIKFDEALAKEITRVNVCGTSNVLDFAREMEVPEVHHISTAYVAGDAESFRESDMDVGQTCRNVYERTKLEAEKLVKSWRHGRHSIYRLGIVVGDTDTGHISFFNGYYGFLGSVWHLRQTFASMSEHKMGEYEANGIGFNQDGMLRLPIWGSFSPISTLNIVPVDWVVKAISDLADLSANDQVFNVVHPRPPKIRWLNDVSLQCLGITDFRYGDSPCNNSKSLLGRFQRIFDRSTAQYIPYITHEAKFDVSNMPHVLGGNYVLPPDVDESFVARLLGYAKSVNFGKK